MVRIVFFFIGGVYLLTPKHFFIKMCDIRVFSFNTFLCAKVVVRIVFFLLGQFIYLHQNSSFYKCLSFNRIFVSAKLLETLYSLIENHACVKNVLKNLRMLLFPRWRLYAKRYHDVWTGIRNARTKYLKSWALLVWAVDWLRQKDKILSGRRLETYFFGKRTLQTCKKRQTSSFCIFNLILIFSLHYILYAK